MFNMQILSKLEYSNYLPGYVYKQIIQQASKMVDQQTNKQKNTMSADLINN